MDKFSMFRCFSDIAAEREYYTVGEEYSIMGTLKEELCSEKYRLYDMQYVHGFADLQKLESHAMVKLSEFVDELTELLEVDIYNRINFTCDYLQNYFEKDSENREFASAYFPDAVSYWEEFDDEIDGDDESKLDAFVRNRHKLQMILPEHLVYDEKEKLLKVSKLCPNFGLYMYKNLKDMFWYDKNITKNYDRLLLSRFLKAEKCYFTDSDYYVLENLTNINSAIVLADVLSESLTFENAKKLIKSEEDLFFRQELDSLIEGIAKSNLEYSKSLILKKLFDEAKKEFNLQGEFNFSLRYIGFQFGKITRLFESYVRENAYRRFYKYLGVDKTDINIDDIKKVEQLNYENFSKSFLANHPDYRNERLIKNEKASLNFEDIKKVHDTLGYLNVYIQKQFISYINNAERKDPLAGIVTE